MRRLLLIVLALLLTLTAPVSAQLNWVTVQAPQVAGIVNATTTRNIITLPQANYGTASILINITTTGTATGTLQLWLQDSSDGGTTWDDLVSSNTFAFGAAVVTQHFFLTAEMVTTGTQGGAVVLETLAAGTVRNGPMGDRIRVREKVSSASGSPVGPSYTITAVFK